MNTPNKNNDCSESLSHSLAENSVRDLPDEWRTHLEIQPTASIDELKTVITKCKSLILNSIECSKERKWLVEILIEFRLRVQQLEDNDETSPKVSVYVMGHHFTICENVSTTKNQYCDHCCNVIWNVVQGAYICTNCNFICHQKCVYNIHRICAFIALRDDKVLMEICPLKGIAAQEYRCAECKESFEMQQNEARLCDYSGLYYCPNCHWNDVIEIPARIIHNWDWEKRPVSRASYQLLTLFRSNPVINIEAINEQLFTFITGLDYIRLLRNKLKIMVKYLESCRNGRSLITSEMKYVTNLPKLFAIDNLEKIHNGHYDNYCEFNLVDICKDHLSQCLSCKGSGYLCELCKNDEVLFPFDSSVQGCENCNSYFHQTCWIERNKKCPKCIRIQNRKLIEFHE